MSGIHDARRVLRGVLMIGLVLSTTALAQEPTSKEIELEP
jgi:hypothetical protein